MRRVPIAVFIAPLLLGGAAGQSTSKGISAFYDALDAAHDDAKNAALAAGLGEEAANSAGKAATQAIMDGQAAMAAAAGAAVAQVSQYALDKGLSEEQVQDAIQQAFHAVLQGKTVDEAVEAVLGGGRDGEAHQERDSNPVDELKPASLDAIRQAFDAVKQGRPIVEFLWLLSKDFATQFAAFVRIPPVATLPTLCT